MDPADLREPICDLRYLLNRGYKRDSALDFVAGRYVLDADVRNLLLRTVFSRDEADDHRGRRIDSKRIKGRSVTMDGFNVLISVETALAGEQLILCDDGFLRDIQGVYAKYRMSEQTRPALEAIVRSLKDLEVIDVFFLLDAPVSYSGEVAKIVREVMEEVGLVGDAVTSPTVDSDLVKRDGIVATSDRVVMEGVREVLDVPRLIAKEFDTLPDCGKKI